MKFSLQNKTAVITGAGSGIGKAIATTFAAQGATIHILELDEAKANTVATAIRADGGRVVVHRCNIALQSDTQKVFDQIGALDILVNNAGIAHVGTVETTSEEELDRLYAVNIKGVYNCIHSCIGSMKERGGVILNVASIASSIGLSNRFAYSMTKGAVLTMTYSVAKDYLSHHIRCNSISPARIHTPFVDRFIAKNYPGQEKEMFDRLSRSQPIGRMGKPQEVADLALYLCSDEAAFITGTDFPIDGGFLKLNE